MTDRNVAIEAYYVRETQKAVLIDYHGTEQWLPKSQIHSEYNNKSEMFIVSEWWAQKNGVTGDVV